MSKNWTHFTKSDREIKNLVHCYFMYCLYGGFKYQDVIHDHYKTFRAEFEAYKGINTDIFSSFPTHGVKKKSHVRVIYFARSW